jgi:hypothetical protein
MVMLLLTYLTVAITCFGIGHAIGYVLGTLIIKTTNASFISDDVVDEF